MYYTCKVIRSFASRDTEKLFQRLQSRRFGNIRRVALRGLMQVDASVTLDDLRVPPGNRLEALKGNRLGQYSIRINNQWRICFVWKDGDAFDVEICDYH